MCVAEGWTQDGVERVEDARSETTGAAKDASTERETETETELSARKSRVRYFIAEDDRRGGNRECHHDEVRFFFLGGNA